VINFRTRAFFVLSAFPLLLAVAAALWAVVYSSYLMHTEHATYFVVFHGHWLVMFAVSAVFFLCGLISLFSENRNLVKK
jgi:hypothetical protein